MLNWKPVYSRKIVSPEYKCYAVFRPAAAQKLVSEGIKSIIGKIISLNFTCHSNIAQGLVNAK